MKKIKIIILGLLLCLGIVMPISANAQERIDNFDIKVNVLEDGTYQVRQIIDYQFDEPRHGIYATIPQQYEMNFNGVKKTYHFPVTNIDVKDYPFDVESGDSVLIKIGDADKYVSGKVRYEYTYDILTRDLGLDGRNMFYFNLVGKGWTVPIEHVNFEINMPKSFNTDPIFYGVNDTQEKISEKDNSTQYKSEGTDYSINGNTITGTYDTTINPGQAYTVLLNLEDNYFLFPNYSATSMKATGLVALVTVISIILFFIYGKDDKVIPVVNFYPPKGMSSCMVGYAIDGQVDNKDITSLFIYWADKGYLKIEEIESDSKTPKFKFIKVKEIDSNEQAVEKALFDSMFIEENEVEIDNMPSEFYDARDLVLTDTGYYFSGDKELKLKKSNTISILMMLALAISITIFVAVNTYNYYRMGIEMIISSIVTFICVFLLLGVYNNAFKNREIRSAKANLGASIVAIIIFIITSALLILYMSWIDVNIIYPLLVILLMVIASGFIIFMDKRTKYGTRLHGELLGLREFIEKAKKDQLEMLVEQNPTYFYNILPYAYVLNVTDKWIKNFETINIQQPDWYVSTHPYDSILFYSVLSSNLNTINATTNFNPDTSGGSGGFSGGGGGFSGGGFGGGGGGSW